MFSASASPLTRTLLVCFAPAQCKVAQLVAVVDEALDTPGARDGAAEATPPHPLTVVALGVAVAHGLVDSAFYALAFAGPFPPLAALGGLHLAFDVAAWGSTVGALAWFSVKGRPARGIGPVN